MSSVVKLVIAFIVLGVSVMAGIWLWQRAQEEGLTDGLTETFDLVRGTGTTSTSTAVDTPVQATVISSEAISSPPPTRFPSRAEIPSVTVSSEALFTVVWECMEEQQDIADRIFIAGNLTSEDSWNKTKTALIAEAPNMVIAVERCWSKVAVFPEAQMCEHHNSLVLQFYRDLPHEMSDKGADWLLSNVHIEDNYLDCLAGLPYV